MKSQSSNPENAYQTYVLDQLAFLEDLHCRPMFGGFGLYVREIFFGMIHRGRLFFQTDAGTQPDYIALGMEVFQPNKKQRLKNYYEVPAEILEDPEPLRLWVGRAISCGLSRRAQSSSKTLPRPRRHSTED